MRWGLIGASTIAAQHMIAAIRAQQGGRLPMWSAVLPNVGRIMRRPIISLFRARLWRRA